MSSSPNKLLTPTLHSLLSVWHFSKCLSLFVLFFMLIWMWWGVWAGTKGGVGFVILMLTVEPPLGDGRNCPIGNYVTLLKCWDEGVKGLLWKICSRFVWELNDARIVRIKETLGVRGMQLCCTHWKLGTGYQCCLKIKSSLGSQNWMSWIKFRYIIDIFYGHVQASYWLQIYSVLFVLTAYKVQGVEQCLFPLFSEDVSNILA